MPTTETSPKSLIEAATAAIAAADAGAARAHLDALIAAGGSETHIERLERRLQRLTTDPAARLEEAEAAIARAPDDSEGYRRRLSALIAAERWTEALDWAHEALERFPDDIPMLEQAQGVAKRQGRAGIAIAWMKRLVELDHRKAHYLAEIGKQQVATFEAEGLVTLQNALRAGAPPRDLLLNLALAAERAGKPAMAKEYWRKLSRLGATAAERARADAALRMLAQRAQTGAAAPVTTVDFKGLLAFGSAPDFKPGYAATRRNDVMAWRNPASRDLVLVFGGIASMMGAARPSLPHDIRVRGKNGVSFADTRRLIALGGIESLGDSFEATVQSLATLAKAWNVERLFMMGVSAGGYPALRYGVALKAKRILTLSGATGLPEDASNPMVMRMIDKMGHMTVDMRELVTGPGADTEVLAVYGADSPLDVYQAERLKGLPNVTLAPLAGVSFHRVADVEDDAKFYDQLFAD